MGVDGVKTAQSSSQDNRNNLRLAKRWYGSIRTIKTYRNTTPDYLGLRKDISPGTKHWLRNPSWNPEGAGRVDHERIEVSQVNRFSRSVNSTCRKLGYWTNLVHEGCYRLLRHSRSGVGGVDSKYQTPNAVSGTVGQHDYH